MISLFNTGRTDIPRRLACTWWTALILMVGSWGLSLPLAAAGQEIAILRSSDLHAYTETIKGFKATAPGSATYVEYDLRGDLERGKRLAKKIRDAHVSLVVAVGLKAAQAAQLEIPDLPILYMMVVNPFHHDLTADNMTGILLEIPADRQFKLLRTFLPNLRQIGVLYDPSKSDSRVQEATLQAAIHQFQLRGFSVQSGRETPQQLRTLLSESDALWLIPDSTVLTNESIRFILESALNKEVPVIGFSPELTRMGALLSLSISYSEVGRETGRLAKRILNHDTRLPLKPIPVEHVRLTVNMKTARYLGITIPKELETLIDETY